MPRGDGRAGARPRHPGAVVAALIWPRYRSSLSPDFGVRLTLRWREPDSNHRSRRERDGPAADHRRLARRPVLNDPIQLIDPASLFGNSERLFTRAGPMVRIRFPPADSPSRAGFLLSVSKSRQLPQCVAPARRHGRQRRAGHVNITPAAGNISVGLYSSTAVPARRFATWLHWCAEGDRVSDVTKL